MNYLATEAFGSRSSIRSLKEPVTGVHNQPVYGTTDHASVIRKNDIGGEPGNPLPCL